MIESTGSVFPTTLPTASGGSPATWDVTRIGTPSAANATGAVLAKKAKNSRVLRGKSERYQHGGRDGDGGSEARGAF